jgi:NAD/NADP transhydrogenase alpha subunit
MMCLQLLLLYMIGSVVSTVGFSVVDSSIVQHRHISTFCQSKSRHGCLSANRGVVTFKIHGATAPLYATPTRSNDEKPAGGGIPTPESASQPPQHHGEKVEVVGGKGGEQDILAAFQQPTTSKILSLPIPYSQLTIGIMKETFPGENRVSITPESASVLIKEGFHVVVQSGAGEKASFSDAEYTSKGAIVLPGDQIYANADIVTKIRPPSEQEIPKLAGKTLVGMISPSIHPQVYDALAEQNTNVFALDCVPRMLSRAQAYDVLSSQANIAGYRAVVEAAEAFPRFFKGQMTAAGKVPPAKVLVLGAGEWYIDCNIYDICIYMDGCMHACIWSFSPCLLNSPL